MDALNVDSRGSSRKWVARLCATLLVAVVVAMAVIVGPATPAQATTSHDEAAFVVRINELRASRGLPSLAVDTRLTATARGWASSMASAGTISHNPNLAAQAPGDWLKLGENVGVGADVPTLHNAFVNSAPHYRNLVDADYTSIGVGVVYSGGRTWVVEMFMRASGPVASPVPSKPAPIASPADRIERYKAVLRQS
jgi:uncharacterized protein YkwD